MYEVWQSANNGNLIIQNERDCVEIETEFVTKFVNELCENEMISEGTKYEELKESFVLLKAENEKLKAKKEPPHVSIVMRSLQEKKKLYEEQLKQDRLSRDFDGMNCVEKWEYYDGCAQRDIQIIETLEEIINQNFA